MNTKSFETKYYCEKCFSIIVEDHCPSLTCGAPFNQSKSLRSGHFFVTLPLKEQLREVLEVHQPKPMPKLTENSYVIRDIYDGRMYRELEKSSRSKSTYSINWNTDGIPTHASSNSSVWPLLVTLNELPVDKRRQNVLLGGIWFGRAKPQMSTFLKPFVSEINILAREGFLWKRSGVTGHTRSYIRCAACCTDAVARCNLQGINQFNGEYGCGTCLQNGRCVPGTNRAYPYRYVFTLHDSIFTALS